MPDKQNIVLTSKNLPAEVDSLMVGYVITTEARLVNAYVTMFKGKDADRQMEGNDDPALVRYVLDAEECGSCNSYIMGM